MLCSVYDRTLGAASIGGALIHLDCGIILWFRERGPSKIRGDIDLARPPAGMTASGSGRGPTLRPLHRDGQAFNE
jgi:hypothetical protein